MKSKRVMFSPLSRSKLAWCGMVLATFGAFVATTPVRGQADTAQDLPKILISYDTKSATDPKNAVADELKDLIALRPNVEQGIVLFVENPAPIKKDLIVKLARVGFDG